MAPRPVACLLVLLAVATYTHAVVVGLDLGSEFFKVVLVKPGSMDAALNEASGRKTPTVIGLTPEERLYGENALALSARAPASAYPYVTQFLGRKINVEDAWFQEQSRILAWLKTAKVDSTTGKITIPHEEETYLPEELIGQLLSYAGNIASTAMGSPVKDFAITVPPYWTHAQRQALLDAGKVAGINILSLINQDAAIALNYGIERNFPEPEFVLFYDMGASDLQVSLYKFTSIEDKKKKSIGGAQLIAQAWDETLGGRYFDQAVVDFVVKKVEAERKVTIDARGLVKLQRAVKRAKEILSANKDTMLTVESLLPDYDFKMKLTREDCEALWADLFARALIPVKKVLAEADMTIDKIQGFELFGGGVRIPKLQDILKETFSREVLDKHLNGDEAAVFGAALYAASISAQHRTKEFRFKDAQLHHWPILVTKTGGTVEEEPANNDASDATNTENTTGDQEDDDEGATKNGDILDLALFKANSRVGSKRTLKFYGSGDFDVSVKYGPSAEYIPGTHIDLGSFQVSGIPTSEQFNLTSRPFINVKFALSTSGTVSLTKAVANITYITTKTIQVPKEVPEEEEAQEEEPTSETSTDASSEASSSSDAESTESSQQQDSSETETQEAKGEEASQEQEEQAAKESQEEQPAEEDKPKTEESEKKAEPKKKKKKVEYESVTKEVVRNTLVTLKVKNVFALGLTDEEFDAARAKLRRLDDREKLRRETSKARNDVEAYIIETRDKMYNDDVIAASTEEEREAVNAALSAGSEWLDEDGFDTTKRIYQDKLKELQDAAHKIFFRVSEATDRPKAVESCRGVFTMTRMLAENITAKIEVTDEEKANLLQKVDDTETWLNESIAVQDTKTATEDPSVTSAEIERKCNEIQARLKILLRRPYKKPPKVEKKPKEKKVEEDKPADDADKPASSEGESVPETPADEKPEATQESTESAPEEEKKDEL